MSWGNAANVTTTHLDSSTDDPSQARTELYLALLELQNVISGRNTANGVAGLDSNTKIVNTYLPDTITSSSGQDLYLSPATDRVNIQDIINLPAKTVSTLEGLTPQNGDIAYCSNGSAGSECLAIYTGDSESDGTPIWYRIALGAQISAT